MTRGRSRSRRVVRALALALALAADLRPGPALASPVDERLLWRCAEMRAAWFAATWAPWRDSRDGRSLACFSWWPSGNGFMHTVDHVLNSLGVVFAEVNHSCGRLLEWMAACTVEEARPRADHCLVYCPAPRTALYFEVRVFARGEQSTMLSARGACQRRRGGERTKRMR